MNYLRKKILDVVENENFKEYQELGNKLLDDIVLAISNLEILEKNKLIVPTVVISEEGKDDIYLENLNVVHFLAIKDAIKNSKRTIEELLKFHNELILFDNIVKNDDKYKIIYRDFSLTKIKYNEYLKELDYLIRYDDERMEDLKILLEIRSNINDNDLDSAKSILNILKNRIKEKNKEKENVNQL